MCNACKTQPTRVNTSNPFQPTLPVAVASLADIRRACRESNKAVPHWLAPKRSTKAELSYQLRRLAGNRQHEAENEVENV